jgi:hypothetical protein
MKLTTTTQVSVDGVMQANGPSKEERMAGFERDGWAMGHFDSESGMFVDQVYQRAGAFLFGRWTYDAFAGYWGVLDPGQWPHRGCLEHQAQVRRVEHAHRTVLVGHDRPIR